MMVTVTTFTGIEFERNGDVLNVKFTQQNMLPWVATASDQTRPPEEIAEVVRREFLQLVEAEKTPFVVLDYGVETRMSQDAFVLLRHVGHEVKKRGGTMIVHSLATEKSKLHDIERGRSPVPYIVVSSPADARAKIGELIRRAAM